MIDVLLWLGLTELWSRGFAAVQVSGAGDPRRYVRRDLRRLVERDPRGPKQRLAGARGRIDLEGHCGREQPLHLLMPVDVEDGLCACLDDLPKKLHQPADTVLQDCVILGITHVPTRHSRRAAAESNKSGIR
ncbi:hypothetical protein ACWDTI_05090 [Gordonia sp. NPDC003424]